VGHHGRQIERHAVRPDAEGREVLLRLFIELGGMKQRLGGNAADIEAGAAERAALFHAGDLEAQLRRADRARVAARPTADDDDVE
jgi:hypothetical protein